MHLKKHFITGLVILLPLALTIAIVGFVFNLLTGPFLGMVKAIFEHYHLLDHGFLVLNADQVQNLVAKLLILFSLFTIVIGLGFIARWFFFNTFLKITEYIVRKIPLVNSIYKICQDVIKTLFTSDTNSFKQVVLARFPHAETYSIGFITRDEIPGFSSTSYSTSVAVFIPTTPNPTSGFLIMFKREELIYLDMKVEEAFKFIISCGMISPEFRSISKNPVFEHTKINQP